MAEYEAQGTGYDSGAAGHELVGRAPRPATAPDIAVATATMRECQENRDHEAAHWEADRVLCGVLRDLGYGSLVDEFDKIVKWYA